MYVVLVLLGFAVLVMLNSAFVPQDSWTEPGKDD
jgi:hypothetical protein